jgi:hypothetical protein
MVPNRKDAVLPIYTRFRAGKLLREAPYMLNPE